MKDIGILHLSYKKLAGGQVTSGERGLGQILSLNDHDSCILMCQMTGVYIKPPHEGPQLLKALACKWTK